MKYWTWQRVCVGIKGFDGTSTSDILNEIGIAMGTLYVSDGNFGQELLKQIHKPQNALMHQKMEKSLLSGINPIITDLIREGMEQGICQTDYPEEAAEMTFLSDGQ